MRDINAVEKGSKSVSFAENQGNGWYRKELKLGFQVAEVRKPSIAVKRIVEKRTLCIVWSRIG